MTKTIIATLVLMLLTSCAIKNKEQSLVDSFFEISNYHQSILDPFQPDIIKGSNVEMPYMELGEHRAFLVIKMENKSIELVSENKSSITVRSTIPGYKNVIKTYIFKDNLFTSSLRTN
ncbi:MAG: hypothetical protein KUG78_02770 [Kangiellaceae bacterium]|nr:hypothetical protein [Kangiellaceae bacterium]